MGGWFFSAAPKWGLFGGGDVLDMYSEDGREFGIFDSTDAEGLAAAEEIAAAGLAADGIDWAEEEITDSVEPVPTQDSQSQLVLTDLSDIASVAPKEEDPRPQESEELPAASVIHLDLTGNEIAALPHQDITALPEGESKVTMLTAPVKYMLVQSVGEYKAFKTRARGDYPAVDFDKQMLIVLESDSNLPDKVFEIINAEETDGKLLVTYRVNVFGLDKKTNTHTVWPVNKTQSEIWLKQQL